MPESRQVEKKVLARPDLDYKSIHAYSNDHVLFRKVLANEEKFPQYDSSCYCKDA